MARNENKKRNETKEEVALVISKFIYQKSDGGTDRSEETNRETIAGNQVTRGNQVSSVILQAQRYGDFLTIIKKKLLQELRS